MFLQICPHFPISMELIDAGARPPATSPASGSTVPAAAPVVVLKRGYVNTGRWASTMARDRWHRVKSIILVVVKIQLSLQMNPVDAAFRRFEALARVSSALGVEKAEKAIVGAHTLDGLAMHTVTPIVPIFILAYGGSSSDIATLLSCFATGQALAAGWMGPGSDVIGRKSMVMVGIGGSVIGHLLCGLSPFLALYVGWSTVGTLAVGRFLLGCGASVRSHDLWILLSARSLPPSLCLPISPRGCTIEPALRSLFNATEAVSHTFLLDVCEDKARLAKASGLMAQGTGAGTILGPLLSSLLLALGERRAAADLAFFVACGLALCGVIVAAIFQPSDGDVAMLELQRNRGRRLSEALMRDERKRRASEDFIPGEGIRRQSTGRMMRRSGGVISKGRASAILEELNGVQDEGLTRHTITMIGVTGLAFFCVKASVVSLVVIMPAHALASIPGFTASMFSLVFSVMSLIGLLSVKPVATRLVAETSPLVANGILAALIAVRAHAA